VKLKKGISMELTTLKAPDGSEIYVQYDKSEINKGLQAVGNNKKRVSVDERTEIFKKGIENNIINYSSMVIEAVKSGAKERDDSSLKSIELEFGLQIGGEAGIPFITKGTIESNINVTVTWEFK